MVLFHNIADSGHFWPPLRRGKNLLGMTTISMVYRACMQCGILLKSTASNATLELRDLTVPATTVLMIIMLGVVRRFTSCSFRDLLPVHSVDSAWSVGI